jgi:hypothetical protein
MPNFCLIFIQLFKLVPGQFVISHIIKNLAFFLHLLHTLCQGSTWQNYEESEKFLILLSDWIYHLWIGKCPKMFILRVATANQIAIRLFHASWLAEMKDRNYAERSWYYIIMLLSFHFATIFLFMSCVKRIFAV